MILVKNSLPTPVCVQIPGFYPTHLAGGGADAMSKAPTPRFTRITEAHRDALLALAADDPRRVAFSQCEIVTDNGSFAPF